MSPAFVFVKFPLREDVEQPMLYSSYDINSNRKPNRL
jgi:hypothetical protein